MQRAILESPYAGAMRDNRIFAENIARAKLHKGWNCFASHLYYPHFLNELSPHERKLGIEAGLQWSEGVQQVFFALPEHIDLASSGMLMAYYTHKKAGRDIHCGIYMHNGELRHEISEQWFFHEKGWRMQLREAAEKVNADE